MSCLLFRMLDNEFTIDDIQEYDCSWDFFFLRTCDGKTFSYPRSEIISIERQLKNGRFVPIHLKKPRKKHK